MSRANDAIELLWLLRKSTKNSPNDMDTVTMWAEMSDKATNARQSAAPDTQSGTLSLTLTEQGYEKMLRLHKKL